MEYSMCKSPFIIQKTSSPSCYCFTLCLWVESNSNAFSAMSNINYCCLLTSVPQPFIRLLLSSLSCPPPQSQACLRMSFLNCTTVTGVHLALCTGAIYLWKSYTTLIANNDELVKRSRGRYELVIAATLGESIMENICHLPLRVLQSAHNPYAN